MIPRWKKTEITQGEKDELQNFTAAANCGTTTHRAYQRAPSICNPHRDPSNSTEHQVPSPPDMEYVMKTVWKELGMSTKK
jgi:hypothetical protein